MAGTAEEKADKSLAAAKVQELKDQLKLDYERKQAQIRALSERFKINSQYMVDRREEQAKQPPPPLRVPVGPQDAGRAFGESATGMPAQIADDVAQGQPSPGGGGLGADVRAAMASVPPELATRMSETTWAPMRFGTGTIPMPTTSRRVIRAPTGMTQAEAANAMLRELAMKQQELDRAQRAAEEEGRTSRAAATEAGLNRRADMLARLEKSRQDAQKARDIAERDQMRRERFAKYAVLLGNAQDAKYASETDPALWDKDFLKHYTSRIHDAEEFQKAEIRMRLATDWYRISEPNIRRRIEAGQVQSWNDVRPEELFGKDPDLTAKQREDIRNRKAEGTTFITQKASGPFGGIENIKPEELWARVGEPAVYDGQLIAAGNDRDDARWAQRLIHIGVEWASVVLPIDPTGDIGIRTIPMNDVFGWFDAITNPNVSPEKRKEIADYLKYLRLISGTEAKTGEPLPVEAGAFRDTSNAAIDAWLRFRELKHKYPELEMYDARREIVRRRMVGSPEAARQLDATVGREVDAEFDKWVKKVGGQGMFRP